MGRWGRAGASCAPAPPPASRPARLPLAPASRLGLLTGAAGRMGQAQRPRPFRLWELGLPGRFLGTSSLWHSVCAFNVQGGAEHGHFDAAAVFRAAPAATFPIVAAVAAAERAAERASATKASAAVQAGAVTLAAQETGRAGSTSAGTSAGTGTAQHCFQRAFRMDGSKSLLAFVNAVLSQKKYEGCSNNSRSALVVPAAASDTPVEYKQWMQAERSTSSSTSSSSTSSSSNCSRSNRSSNRSKTSSSSDSNSTRY